MLTIIGLVGAKGAGKSTVARLIREAYPQVREGALAGKLKDECSSYFGIPREAFDDPELKERYLGSIVDYNGLDIIILTHCDVASLLDSYRLRIDPIHIDNTVFRNNRLYTPRQLAQFVGTEVLRAVDPDVHCKALMKDQSEDGVLIVTDIRFPNELAFFKNRPDSNFIGVFVQNLKAEAEAVKDAHTSESHLRTLEAECEYRLYNDDTSLEDLKDQALHILTAHLSLGE